jgi:hypothetical protein
MKNNVVIRDQRIILEFERRARREKEEKELLKCAPELVDCESYDEIADYARMQGQTVGKVNSIRERILKKRRDNAAKKRAEDRRAREKALRGG